MFKREFKKLLIVKNLTNAEYKKINSVLVKINQTLNKF